MDSEENLDILENVLSRDDLIQIAKQEGLKYGGKNKRQILEMIKNPKSEDYKKKKKAKSPKKSPKAAKAAKQPEKKGSPKGKIKKPKIKKVMIGKGCYTFVDGKLKGCPDNKVCNLASGRCAKKPPKTASHKTTVGKQVLVGDRPALNKYLRDIGKPTLAVSALGVGAPPKKPPAKKPPAKKPTAKKPPAKKPTAKKPAAKKPAVKKPAESKKELTIDLSQQCPILPHSPERELINLQNACTYYAQHRSSDASIKRKWQESLRLAERVVSPNFSQLTAQQLKQLFDIFDHVYFRGGLWKLVCSQGATLKFKVSKKLTSTAGHCSKRGCHYTITLGENLFTNLFKKKGEDYYESNGLPCYNRLECLLNVFAHELTHLVLQRFCHLKGESAHGPTFKRFVRNMYGQTDTKHSLHLPREKGQLTKDEVKNRIKLGQRYYAMMKMSRGAQPIKLEVKVVRKNPKTASVVFSYNNMPYKGKVSYSSFVL